METTKKRPKGKFTALDKSKHVEAWHNSGQSIAEYCIDNKVSPSALRRWKSDASLSNSGFQEVKVKPSSTAIPNRPCLMVKTSCGLQLYFNAIQDIPSMVSLLRGLT